MCIRDRLTAGVLTTAGVACVLSPLDVVGGSMVVGLVSLSRCLAAAMLVDVPPALRPPLIYAGGLAGVIAARCIESALLQSADSASAGGGGGVSGPSFGSPATMKRRRASTSAAHHKVYSTYAAGRRVSLPTLVHKSLVRQSHYYTALPPPEIGSAALSSAAIPPSVCLSVACRRLTAVHFRATLTIEH